jgi:DNA-binding IclR family transcriptional regulator
VPLSKDPSVEKDDIYYIEVLGKAMDILDAFVPAEKPLLSLQELSIATGLNKNTVFRVLYTLAKHGYVTKENHLYRLGQRMTDLGNARLHGQDLVTVAGPCLTALRDDFGETVNLGVLSGGTVCYVDVRESNRSFRLAERIGGTDPLHSTALGKAQLAFLSQYEVRDLMKKWGMKKYTAHTITSLSALLTDLKRIRTVGYALDDQESMLGAFCVAAPILNAAKHPVAAISIAGPMVRFNESHLPKVSVALLKAAAEIHEKLGS